MHKRYTGYRLSKKLNPDDAQQIRELYATGEYTQIELARNFDVNQSTISSVVRNNSHMVFKTAPTPTKAYTIANTQVRNTNWSS